MKVLTNELKKGDVLKYEGQYAVVYMVNSSHSGRGARSFNVFFIVMIKDTIEAAQSTKCRLYNSTSAYCKRFLRQYDYSFL